ncbi:hypothetical protein Srufu_036270 [Streptomyces libani subsp. rufus]|nr:hypothetical protein Srufu_036270 [Streptomyces libani subsp. rufus]
MVAKRPGTPSICSGRGETARASSCARIDRAGIRLRDLEKITAYGKSTLSATLAGRVPNREFVVAVIVAGTPPPERKELLSEAVDCGSWLRRTPFG